MLALCIYKLRNGTTCTANSSGMLALDKFNHLQRFTLYTTIKSGHSLNEKYLRNSSKFKKKKELNAKNAKVTTKKKYFFCSKRIYELLTQFC